MVFLYLSGFKRSGKDTFCNDIINNNISRWLIYSKSYTEQIFNDFLHKSWKRMSFADKLKMMVRNKYFPLYTLNFLEMHKDDKIFNGKSFRDYCISYSKTKDKNYWIESCMKNININENYIVTDWRFPHEYYYMLKKGIKPYTFRIFRDVDIPEEENEHLLDDFIADFLVINKKCNIGDAVKIFPQYKDYILTLD